MKKIAHFGAFDHDSYGDLLFPKVAEFLFPDFDLTHVALTSGKTAWTDACPVIGIDEAIRRADWDGILVGGGDIIHTAEWRTKKWKREIFTPFCGLPALWMGSAFLSTKLNIPVAWNAPGVPSPFPDWFAESAKSALGCCDYVAVRDVASRANLTTTAKSGIAVVPDSAVAIARMWPRRETRDHIVISPSRSDAATRASEINGMIEQLTQTLGILRDDVVAAPLMRWESEESSGAPKDFSVSIAARAASECESLKSAALLIGESRGYIGNSLHGLITAIAYGVPAVIIPPSHNPGAHKYRGFLEVCGIDPDKHIATNWTQAGTMLTGQKPQAITNTLPELDAHVERVRQVLNSGSIDKTDSWRRIATSIQKMGEALFFCGVPPDHLKHYSKNCETKADSFFEQTIELKQHLDNATAREQQLLCELEAWRKSFFGRLSHVANTGCHVVAGLVKKPRRIIRARNEEKKGCLHIHKAMNAYSFPKLYFFSGDSPFFWVRASTTQSHAAAEQGCIMEAAFQKNYPGGDSIPVFNRFCSGKVYGKIIAICRHQKIPYLVDIDDLFWELPDYSADEAKTDAEHLQSLESLCGHSWGLIASTPYLSKRLREKFPGKPVFLVENSPPAWHAPPGSLLIANTDALKMSSTNTEWFAKILHEAWELGVGLQLIGENDALTSCWLEPFAHSVPRLSYDEYHLMLRGGRFSLGLVPVEQSPYADAKSAVKILEMLTHGIPVVASETAPHRQLAEEHGTLPLRLVENTEEAWRNAICDAVGKLAGEQIETGKSVNAMLRETRIRQLSQWAEVYKSLPDVDELPAKNEKLRKFCRRQRVFDLLNPYISTLLIIAGIEKKDCR